MKTQSEVKPNKFIIENYRNGKVTISFFDNITEKEKLFYYDMYRITLNNRTNLEQDIEDNYDEWLQFAKDCEYEKLATEMKAMREDAVDMNDRLKQLEQKPVKEYEETKKVLRDKVILFVAGIILTFIAFKLGLKDFL